MHASDWKPPQSKGTTCRWTAASRRPMPIRRADPARAVSGNRRRQTKPCASTWWNWSSRTLSRSHCISRTKVITDLSEVNLRSKAGEIKDRIVLFHTERVCADGFNKTYTRLIASYRVFKGLGARAILFNDTVPNNVLGDWLDIDNGQAELQ